MAKIHKVTEGENLSQIASKYGVSTRDISGYRSGDPSKIYPGEELTIDTEKTEFNPYDPSTWNTKELTPKIQDFTNNTGDADMTEEPPAVDTTDNTSATSVKDAAKDEVDEMDETWKKRYNQLLESQKEMQKQSKTLLSQMQEQRQKGRPEAPDFEQIRRETLKEFGYTPEARQEVKKNMSKIEQAQQEVQNLKKQRREDIQELGSMPQPHYRGHVAQIEKQYNSRIAAQQAEAKIAAQQIELRRKNFRDARVISNQIVSDITQQHRQEVNDYEWQMQTYSDLYNKMSREEQQNWNRAYKLSKDRYQKTRKEWENKLSVQQTAYENGIAPGWTKDYMESKSSQELLSEIGPQLAIKSEEQAPSAYKKMFNELVDAGEYKEGQYGKFLEDRGVIEKEAEIKAEKDEPAPNMRALAKEYVKDNRSLSELPSRLQTNEMASEMNWLRNNPKQLGLEKAETPEEASYKMNLGHPLSDEEQDMFISARVEKDTVNSFTEDIEKTLLSREQKDSIITAFAIRRGDWDVVQEYGAKEDIPQDIRQKMNRSGPEAAADLLIDAASFPNYISKWLMKQQVKSWKKGAKTAAALAEEITERGREKFEKMWGAEE